MNIPPVKYLANFVPNPNEVLNVLQNELDWERREDAPRCEYYCNDILKPYIYGRGKGRRLYEVRAWHPVLLDIKKQLESYTSTKFEVCFLNRYLNQSDHLGWHADDSPEMDDNRSIAIISFGVERDIWFREKESNGEKLHSLKLGNGSLCLMAPGMQDTYQHRIPKASFLCGERISLTFRGYVNDNS